MYKLIIIVPFFWCCMPINMFFNSCFLIFPDARSYGLFELIHVPSSFVVNLISPSLIWIRILPLKIFFRISLRPIRFLPYIFPLIFTVFSFLSIEIGLCNRVVRCDSRFFTIPPTEDDSKLTFRPFVWGSKFYKNVFIKTACIDFNKCIILDFIHHVLY